MFLKGLCNDVPNAIKSAKLFVLSSDHEGCPNVLMEAMALGIPCVSTACLGGGPQMLFGAELKDCLVPANNSQAMADKILANSCIPKHMEVATIADISSLLQIDVFSLAFRKHVLSTLMTQPLGKLTQ